MTAFRAPDEIVDLTNCDREPIHIPGTIQPHGMLLAVHEPDLRVVQASANTAALLGIETNTLLGHPLDTFMAEGQAVALRNLLAQERLIHPYLTQLAFTTPTGNLAFDAMLHRRDNLLLLELEDVDAEGTPERYFRGLHDVMSRLREATSVDAICTIVVQEVRRLTGYDRTMIYRFDAEGNGEVIAEARREDLEPYLGLHYPASDIPQQARRLYLVARTRVIADVAYTPVPVVPTDNPLTGEPLDLSMAVLRSVSPIHLEYLRNMGVAATLGVTLIKDGALWGMIMGHHCTPHRCAPVLRSVCDLLGHLVSLLITARSEHENAAAWLEFRERYDQIAARILVAKSLPEPLMAASPTVQDLTHADGVAMRLGGGDMLLYGRTPAVDAVQSIVDRIREEYGTQIFISDALGERFPEFAPLRETASGVLILPIVHSHSDYLVWFRGERIETVLWGGNPHEPVAVDLTTGQIGPRRSFAVWKEQVRGRAHPWHPAAVAVVTDLRQAIVSAMLHLAEAQLSHLGLYDALTDLPNRRFLLECLMESHRRRATTRGVALLFLDVDHFKTVNDTLGHVIGDCLLVAVAQRLRESVRNDTVVARLSGDEFVVWCDDITRDEAEKLAYRIFAAFQRPFLLEDHRYHATVSGGLAFATHTSGDEDLLRDADRAMYQAKRSGGNRFAVFDRDRAAQSGNERYSTTDRSAP